MKKYFISSFFNKRIEIVISILFFTILFNNKISSILLAILVLLIFWSKKNYEFKLTKQNKTIILFFIYLLIRELFCLEKKGIDYIIRLLPLLILPISLGFYSFKKDQIKFILKNIILINYFFYGVAITLGIYMYLNNYFNNGIVDFRYYQWAVPLKIKFHPPYWGLFIVLSVIFILRSNLIENYKKFIFCLFSFSFLLLLSSRSALLSIVFVVALEVILNKSISSKIKYFILFLFISSSITLSLSKSYLTKKIKNNSGIQERVKLWNASTDALKENYFFGNSGDKAEEIIKYFYDLKNEKIDNYDPHNQFLFFSVSYGIIGLTLFLLILFYNENYNLKDIMFLFVIIISFSTESVLHRQMGVFMFALFLSFIVNLKLKYIY